MRKITLPFVAILAVSCFVSCQHQQESLPENDLYSEMVNYSHRLGSLFQTIHTYQTRSDDLTYYKEQESEIDYSVLDDKIINYLDLYTQSEDINNWDEQAVLYKVSKDPTLEDDAKVTIARSIAFAYYIKNTSEFALTRAVTAEECYQAYKKASNRALRRALFTLAVGLLEPTLAGEALAVGIYAFDMMDAEEDLNDCLAKTRIEL